MYSISRRRPLRVRLPQELHPGEVGPDDLDGAPLMRAVFSRNNPILAFNDLSDQTAQDEQEGMMHLFEGAMLGIRNPRAHDILSDDPQRALEYTVLFCGRIAGAEP